MLDIKDTSIVLPRYEECYPYKLLEPMLFQQEKYTRVLWSPFAKHCLIGFRHSNGAITRQVGDVIDFKVRSKKEKASTDCYYTPNQFFQWRRKGQVALLGANWLDIDVVKRSNSRATVDSDAAELFEEVLKLLLEKDIPVPSGYVSSGSGGVHVYWLYRPIRCTHQAAQQWVEISRRLCDALKKESGSGNWKTDVGASINIAGLLRLPGSYNSKTGAVAKAYLSDCIYDFDELAEKLLIVHSEIDTAAIPRKKHRKLSRNFSVERQNRSKHNIKKWWLRIYSELIAHFYAKGAVHEGKRDQFIFICCVALLHVYDPSEVTSKLKSLNHSLVGWPESELLASTKSANKFRYKFTKDKVAERLETLGVNTAFLYRPQRPSLTHEEIIAKQSNAGKTTAIQRKNATYLRINKAYKVLARNQTKVTQRQVAEATKLSERTIRRYWKDVLHEFNYCNHQPDKRSSSIYTASLDLSFTSTALQNVNASKSPCAISVSGVILKAIT